MVRTQLRCIRGVLPLLPIPTPTRQHSQVRTLGLRAIYLCFLYLLLKREFFFTYLMCE